VSISQREEKRKKPIHNYTGSIILKQRRKRGEKTAKTKKNTRTREKPLEGGGNRVLYHSRTAQRLFQRLGKKTTPSRGKKKEA